MWCEMCIQKAALSWVGLQSGKGVSEENWDLILIQWALRGLPAQLHVPFHATAQRCCKILCMLRMYSGFVIIRIFFFCQFSFYHLSVTEYCFCDLTTIISVCSSFCFYSYLYSEGGELLG